MKRIIFILCFLPLFGMGQSKLKPRLDSVEKYRTLYLNYMHWARRCDDSAQRKTLEDISKAYGKLAELYIQAWKDSVTSKKQTP